MRWEAVVLVGLAGAAVALIGCLAWSWFYSGMD